MMRRNVDKLRIEFLQSVNDIEYLIYAVAPERGKYFKRKEWGFAPVDYVYYLLH